MAQLNPLNDRIIVRREAAPELSPGGIALPETNNQHPDRGTVIAVGPGARSPSGERVPLEIRVGDTVVFGKYGGTTIKVDGEELLVMREEDIFGVVAAQEN